MFVGVHIVDKNAGTFGASDRMERVEVWGKMGGENASNFPFLPLLLYGMGGNN